MKETHFTLSDEDMKKVNTWYETLIPKILEIQNKSGNEEYPYSGDLPYYGAIGGGLSYIFVPNALGTVVKVKEYYTQEELNLTNYSDW